MHSSDKEEYLQTNKVIAGSIRSSPSTKGFMPQNRASKRTPMFSKGGNHKLIKNAISKVCLAGELNKKQREEAFEIIGKVPREINVIVLFKDTMETRQDFKALYTYNEEEEVVERIYGLKDSPAVLEESMIQNFYRYDNGAREFKKLLENKSFSIAVDAVSLKPGILKRRAKDNNSH